MSAHRNERPAPTPQADQQPSTTGAAREPMDHYETIFKNMIVPIFTLVGYAFDKLPHLAAAMSIAWIVWQWYHSPPMLERRAKKRAYKLKAKR